MKSNYNVIIVGGGPAGSMAALECAKAGLKVCLFEKTSRIGSRFRCGEAMSKNALSYFFNVKEDWVSREISYCNINSPSGIKLRTKFKNDKCLILNRKVFDYELALKAEVSGCEIYTKSIVKDLIFEKEKVRGVEVERDGQRYEVLADIIIAADGIESRIGRKVGIKTQVKMKDMESGIQYLVDDINIDSEALDMYVGDKISPGGYLWIFPKGERKANIGLAISGKYSPHKSAKKYLDRFINKQFPDSRILSERTGGIIVSKPIEKPVKNNVLLVGDAAHHINPLTGGGIASAMKSGMYAGTVASKAIKAKSISQSQLGEYIKLINKDFIRRHKTLYNIKEAILKLSDSDFDKIASSISNIPENKLKLSTIFKSAVYKKPSLVFDVVRVLAGY